MRNLSKSKILAYRQCPKRLWLEIHKPELRDDSGSESVFQIGSHVGEVARRSYDPENRGTTLNIAELGHSEALALSSTLLAEGRAPIFEAGLTIPGALAYADVMLPDHSKGILRWRMIEVKSSGNVKPYQRDDLAVQSYLAAKAGIPILSASIAHIDNRFVYQGDGDYRGLLHEEDLTDEVQSRHGEVTDWIAGAQETVVRSEEPIIASGPQCSDPYPCAFCHYCDRDTVRPEYPISSLPHLTGWRREAVEAVKSDDLRDIPDDLLTSMQLRVKQASVSGEPYFDAEGAASDLALYGFPAYFLDFETVMFAVPIWKDTRPFQQIPFQYSIHVLTEDGELGHSFLLDLSGADPSEKIARFLIKLCGTTGPIFVYNAGFEKRVLRYLAARFPDLASALEALIIRVVDLKPIARSRYYHPSQQGSWSLKAILPAAIPELSYDQLEGVQDGGMAVEAFMEAIAPGTTPEKREEIESQLHAYCQLDTLAMVKLWELFAGIASDKRQAGLK